MAAAKRISVILAGGSGTRFWPASRSGEPKQYLKLFGDRSLIEQTFDRTFRWSKPDDIFVCSAQLQKPKLDRLLPGTTLFLEPLACNTGPAVLLSALQLLKRGYSEDSVLAIFPADHFIRDTDAFVDLLNRASLVAGETGGLVTLGIVPDSAHTGYGYIEMGNEVAHGAHKVSRFVEKPDGARAAEFVRSGKFFWNSGIFLWTLGAILKAYRELAHGDYELLANAIDTGRIDEAYRSVTRLPVDKMILEKASNVFVLPARMGWSDIGSWNALYDLKQKDAAGNVDETGGSVLIDAQNCLVRAPGKKVSVIGLKDVLIVADGDNILVCARDHDQEVREAANRLETPAD